ncbi:hypothetical protein HAX54_027439 [Datura stramonium]|uniref:Uncharacterized protein n=1 Tax=Datura stramonium TaxID=4076 RepID=A0ABS8S8R1_DATST|nr:hypothetical protein [Datura stramonium]
MSHQNWHKVEEDSAANQSSVSDFGDDNFAVGCWEQKEIISRDGQRKLQTQVFFASIDQRSEQAAGESACTALVAVIADWLHNNSSLMLIKSPGLSLFREGSLEWKTFVKMRPTGSNFLTNAIWRQSFKLKYAPFPLCQGSHLLGSFNRMVQCRLTISGRR